MAKLLIAILIVAFGVSCGTNEDAGKSTMGKRIGGDVDAEITELVNVAIYSRKNGDIDTELKALDKLVLLTSGEERALLKRRGIVLYESNRFSDALTDLVDAVNPKEVDLELYLYVGRTMSALGNTKEAKESFLRAVALIESKPVLSGVTTISLVEEQIYLELGEVQVKECKLRDARNSLLNGMKGNSGSVKLFERLLELSTELQRKELAIEYCRKPLLMRVSYCSDGLVDKDSVLGGCNEK